MKKKELFNTSANRKRQAEWELKKMQIPIFKKNLIYVPSSTFTLFEP